MIAEDGRPNPDPNQQARGEGCRRCVFEARGRLGKERVGVAHERRARADEGHASHTQPDDRRLGAGRHTVLDSGRLPAVARCWAAGRGSVVGVTTNLYNPSAAYSARRLGCLALSTPCARCAENRTRRFGLPKSAELAICYGEPWRLPSAWLARSTRPTSRRRAPWLRR